MWADWKTKFLDVVNFHAPIRTRRARIKKAPWINSEFKKGMRDRDATKRKAMASHDLGDWAKYKKLRNTINNNIKTSKASYFSNAFSQSKGNSRKTWQTINELTSRRTNNTNGSIISNSSELSNAFNDQMIVIIYDLIYINDRNVNFNKFSFSSTSSSIVFSHLNKLCRSKDLHNNT